MLLALVPAHNESAGIVDAISGLRQQTVPPDKIVVVADNCTDDTADLARAAGVEVLETVGNRDKKAGALNQALDIILPSLSENSLILVQDADTTLSSGFFEIAVERLNGNEDIGAVGGSFFPKSEPNALTVMQGNEYARYVREISRRREARANVLTGAGSIFRVSVLKQVADARDCGRLPGSGVYKQDALTEDNELTLAIKTLGYKVVSPRACEIHTDVPATARGLYEQRLRWRRGALEDIRAHGLSRVTAPYIGKLAWSLIATGASALYVAILVMMLVSGVPLAISGFWISVFAIYWLDRIWTLKGRSRKSTAMAAAVIPEMLYDLFQQAVLLVALWFFVTKRDQRWVH